MTDLVLRIGASKLVLSVVLGLVAWAIERRWNRPATAHTLWLLVPCVMLIPAVYALPVAGLPGWASIGHTGVRAMAPRAVELLLGTPPGPGAEWVKRGLVMLWLAGSALVLVWSLVRAHRFDRRLRVASRPAAAGLQQIVLDVGGEMGLRDTPVVLTTRASLSPLVWWTGGRPRLVIPDSVLNAVPARELRWIVAHELAHIRRHDHRVRWIEWLACVAFWWNPVVWWARRRLREAEELCCDALVLRSMRADARAYAGSLLTVVDVLSSGVTLHAPALASGADGGGRTRTIERRLKMIVGGAVTSKTPRRLRVVLGLCVLAMLPLGLTYCGTDETGSTPVAPDAASDAVGLGAVRNETTAATQSAPSGRLQEVTLSRVMTQAEQQAAAAKVELAVKTGDLTPEQAREMLETIRQRSIAAGATTAGSLKEVALAPVESDHEAGLVTETQSPRSAPVTDKETRARFEAESWKIRAALEAGKLTVGEARQRMAALEQAMTRETLRRGGERR